MVSIKPISTSIVQIIQSEEKLILREDYYKFNGDSNVYCIIEGKLAWIAELPEKEDYYSNDLLIKNGKLIGYSWSGFSVDLDIETGKILDKRFAK